MGAKIVPLFANAWWTIYDVLMVSMFGLIVAVVTDSPRAALAVIIVATVAVVAFEFRQGKARRGADLARSD